MSWSFTTKGSSEAVRRTIAKWIDAIAGQHYSASDDVRAGQERQVRVATRAIELVAASLSGKHDIQVTASGHHGGDAHDDSGSLTIQISYVVPEGTIRDPVRKPAIRPDEYTDRQWMEELDRMMDVHAQQRLEMATMPEDDPRRARIEEHHALWSAARDTHVEHLKTLEKAPEDDVTDGKPIPSIDE
jgi:hypothetical protein